MNIIYSPIFPRICRKPRVKHEAVRGKFLMKKQPDVYEKVGGKSHLYLRAHMHARPTGENVFTVILMQYNKGQRCLP